MPTANLNGGAYSYEDRGQGDKVIFFGHGLLYNWHSWEHQLEHFASKGYRAIAIDWRGQGDSTGEGESVDFSLYQLGDDAYDLMQQLGIGKCHWVGLSMGGMVGMRLYQKHPEIFESLSLLDTSAADDKEHIAAYTMLAETYRAVGLVPPVAEGLHGVFYTAGFPPSKPDIVAYWDNYWTNANREGLYKSIFPVIDRDDISEKVGQINVPTLVMVGEQDNATPIYRSEDLNRRIAGSKLVIIPDAGHMSCVEQPEAVTQALDEFISSM